MKFSVGDKIIVRGDMEHKAPFVPSMKNKEGKMLEVLEISDKTKNITLSDGLIYHPTSLKQFIPKKGIPHFQIGQIVKIAKRTGYWEGFTDGMAELVGTHSVITYIDLDDEMPTATILGYYFPIECLEPYEPDALEPWEKF